jgi:hypothetical protein
VVHLPARIVSMTLLFAVSALAARGGGPAAFERRCIPGLTALDHSFQGSNTAGILPRRACAVSRRGRPVFIEDAERTRAVRGAAPAR